ncbi:BatD family protein [Jhaorihella thermophila]|uniref:Oxygen tolerance n=1 Tax=Jhaorihella thermophila TaxID=488547 RepID=A0A1H5VS75_9RHOB|nr:BatD family protein [Jhaorihella thermophila]SEF90132.1 Oxygen tolerance [Jhaorihella thermophila]
MIRALLCLALLILAGSAAAQDAAPPVAEVTFEQTETIPGQALDLRVTVLVPTWMTQPVVFPSLEAPNLLVRLPGRATVPISRRVGGETWSGVSRRYRLTPLVEGSFTVPDQPLIVTWSDPDTGKPRKDTATMPGIAFRAVRPEGTETLDPFIAATALTLSQDLSGAEAPLKPGDSVTRVVTATIDGAPPMLLPALIPSTPVQGVAQYPAEPVLTEDDGPDGISGTRRESVTYLAQGGGTGAAAPIELRWFNLTTGRIETAGLPGVDLTVDAPVASGLRSLDPRLVAAAAVASAAALAAILFVARRLWRRWRRVRAERRARYRASTRWARKQALRAAAARDLDATLRALDLWAGRSDEDPRADPAFRAHCLPSAEPVTVALRLPTPMPPGGS